MVKFFKAYTLQADDDCKIGEGVAGQNEFELEKLMEDFNPTQDRTDAILLYLLTGEDHGQVMQHWLMGN